MQTLKLANKRLQQSIPTITGNDIKEPNLMKLLNQRFVDGVQLVGDVMQAKGLTTLSQEEYIKIRQSAEGKL